MRYYLLEVFNSKKCHQRGQKFENHLYNRAIFMGRGCAEVIILERFIKHEIKIFSSCEIKVNIYELSKAQSTKILNES